MHSSNSPKFLCWNPVPIPAAEPPETPINWQTATRHNENAPQHYRDMESGSPRSQIGPELQHLSSGLDCHGCCSKRFWMRLSVTCDLVQTCKVGARLRKQQSLRKCCDNRSKAATILSYGHTVRVWRGLGEDL